MRNSIYYGSRAFAREINRQRSQHQRSMEAAIRRAEREEIYEEGYNEAKVENERLQSIKQNCFDYAENMMTMDPYFDFDLLRNKYIEEYFIYNKVKPKYVDNASLIKVPKQSKLENFVKPLQNRRLNLEKKFKEQQIIDQNNFNERLEAYNEEKEKARFDFEKDEKLRKKKIEAQNKRVDKFEKDYYNHSVGIQEKFLNTLLNKYLQSYTTNMFDKYEIKYDDIDKTVVFDLTMSDVYNFFEYSKCKYIKTRNELSYSYYKDSEIKKEFINLLPNIALGFTNLFLNNDLNNSIDCVFINIIYNEVCLLSLVVTKDEFKVLNAYHLEDLKNIRLFKSLTHGVKPFKSVNII